MRDQNDVGDRADRAPGDRDGSARGGSWKAVGTYTVGLALAAGLTLASFGLVGNQFLWAPVLPVVLIVLAIAQMGVHLVFFLHISTGPDNSSNVMALAFGVLIVFLVVGGSLWIMANTNANMMPADMTKMSR